MKFDLSKFKKISEDQRSAVLKHPSGHQIQIAKSALSSKMKEDLSSLPLHYNEGGSVPDQSQASNEPMSKNNQPTIIINNGQPQQSQGQVAGAPSYFPNGTFDFDKYAASSDAPLSTKVGDLQFKQGQEDQAKQAADQQAKDKLAQVQTYNQLAAKRGLPPMEMPQGMAVPIAAPENSLPSAASPSLPQGPQDPYGTQAYYDAYSHGLGGQKAGIQQEAQAMGQQGQAQAQALDQSIQTQQTQMQDYQTHLKVLNDERENFLNDVQNQHIDAKHYLNSMGTSQKIATGIGLILGGMSGGLLHQENPVMKMLQNQIDLDVHAQEANLGKSKSLLEANMRQFGNLRDAADMTRAQQMGIVSDQLKEAAAEASTPLAKARALQAAGQLDQQAAPILSQMAMRKTLLGGLQSGKMDPSSAVRMIVPEHQQASAYKELQSAQELTKARDDALGVFDQLSKINTVGNRVMSPIQSSRSVAAARDNAAVILARDEAGRVNEFEFEAAKKLFPQPGDNDDTLMRKRNDLSKIVEKKMNSPILQSYGINPFQGRYNAGGTKPTLGAPVVK